MSDVNIEEVNRIMSDFLNRHIEREVIGKLTQALRLVNDVDVLMGTLHGGALAADFFGEDVIDSDLPAVKRRLDDAIEALLQAQRERR